MIYDLVNTCDGQAAVYQTQLRIEERNDEIVFAFLAEHSSYYCPYADYNENHYEGDVCEVFIGAASDPGHYYEVEVTPLGGLFFGRITYSGTDAQGNPITSIAYVSKRECFVRHRAKLTRDGYVVEIAIDKAHLNADMDDLVFNAFRIETDGGKRDKHLFALCPTFLPRFHVPSRFAKLKDYCE